MVKSCIISITIYLFQNGAALQKEDKPIYDNVPMEKAVRAVQSGEISYKKAAKISHVISQRLNFEGPIKEKVNTHFLERRLERVYVFYV